MVIMMVTFTALLLLPVLLLLAGISRVDAAASIRFAASEEPSARPLPWAARQLQQSLRAKGIPAVVEPPYAAAVLQQLLSSPPAPAAGNTITLLASAGEAAAALPGAVSLGREGFQLLHRGGGAIVIVAASGAGAMYGALDLAERIFATTPPPPAAAGAHRSLLGSVGAAAHGHHVVDARFGYRAIKINLPWSPYRSGPATELQMPGARSLVFWEALLDHLARSRFNVLSIWSEHPFPYMIRPRQFPNATARNETELTAWKALHTGIFKLARDRAIQPGTPLHSTAYRLASRRFAIMTKRSVWRLWYSSHRPLLQRWLTGTFLCRKASRITTTQLPMRIRMVALARPR